MYKVYNIFRALNSLTCMVWKSARICKGWYLSQRPDIIGTLLYSASVVRVLWAYTRAVTKYHQAICHNSIFFILRLFYPSLVDLRTQISNALFAFLDHPPPDSDWEFNNGFTDHHKSAAFSRWKLENLWPLAVGPCHGPINSCNCVIAEYLILQFIIIVCAGQGRWSSLHA